jgi:hypothetical protein
MGQKKQKDRLEVASALPTRWLYSKKSKRRTTCAVQIDGLIFLDKLFG